MHHLFSAGIFFSGSEDRLSVNLYSKFYDDTLLLNVMSIFHTLLLFNSLRGGPFLSLHLVVAVILGSVVKEDFPVKCRFQKVTSSQMRAPFLTGFAASVYKVADWLIGSSDF